MYTATAYNIALGTRRGTTIRNELHWRKYYWHGKMVYIPDVSLHSYGMKDGLDDGLCYPIHMGTTRVKRIEKDGMVFIPCMIEGNRQTPGTGLNYNKGSATDLANMWPGTKYTMFAELMLRHQYYSNYTDRNITWNNKAYWGGGYGECCYEITEPMWMPTYWDKDWYRGVADVSNYWAELHSRPNGNTQAVLCIYGPCSTGVYQWSYGYDHYDGTAFVLYEHTRGLEKK